MANYCRPSENNPKIPVVSHEENWLPGDILIYWNDDLETHRIRHVNIYTGPFSGIDNEGKFYPAASGFDVVNASIDYERGAIEYGTGIRAARSEECRNSRFGREFWTRVRVLEMEQEHAKKAFGTRDNPSRKRKKTSRVKSKGKLRT